MKTGIELIAQERQEQIEKHGWDLSNDADYGKGELIDAARFSLTPGKQFLWPWHDFGIGTHFKEKIEKKQRLQQLIVAGAFIAAEIDRLQNI